MNRVRENLLKLQWKWIVPLALFAALAPWPFGPEPHALEKLRWLGEGRLTRPIDVFDLVFHTAPLLLIIARGLAQRGSNSARSERET